MKQPTAGGRQSSCDGRAPTSPALRATLRHNRKRKLALAFGGLALALGGVEIANSQDCCFPQYGWSQPCYSHPAAPCPRQPPAPLAPYPPSPPSREAPRPRSEGPELEPPLPPDLTTPEPVQPETPVQQPFPGLADLSSYGATRGALSTAPGMLGDTFSSPSGALSVIPLPVAQTVHHTFALGGIDDLHAIEFTGPGNVARFPAGPNNPPFYVLQNFQGPPPPLGATVPGLIEGTTGEGPFTAVLTDRTATIPGSDNNQNIPIINAPVYVITQPVAIAIPSPSGGAGSLIGRQKIAENSSPIPRDRVFFNYSLFHNTGLPGALDVNRYTPGFEKTFWDGATSFEARFPFASTLDNDVRLDPNALDAVPEDVEFGNISMIFKALLWEEETWAVSIGLQLTVPTAKDIHVRAADGTPLVDVENDSAHLAPFLGGVYANGRLFTQGYIQIDAAAQGNRVWVRNFPAGRLDPAGELRDATYLYADWGIGYWLYQNPNATLVTAAAPIFEAHLNQSLETAGVVQSGLFQVGSPAENVSVLNLIVGGVLRLGGQSTLMIGYATPLGAAADREFDGELRVVFNRFFGSTFGAPY